MYGMLVDSSGPPEKLAAMQPERHSKELLSRSLRNRRNSPQATSGDRFTIIGLQRNKHRKCAKLMTLRHLTTFPYTKKSQRLTLSVIYIAGILLLLEENHYRFSCLPCFKRNSYYLLLLGINRGSSKKQEYRKFSTKIGKTIE